MRPLSSLLPLILLVTSAVAPIAAASATPRWTFVPPEGSGVVNVKDFGAIGDGIADDTEAIRAAVVAAIDVSRYRANPFVYLPKGTYKVSGPIEGRKGGKGTWSAGWLSMMLMLGEDRNGTIIKLADNAEGYGDAAKPKWVIACGSEGDNKENEGGGGNRAFRHGFLNFTVDVGAGNPGAIAIDFVASNRGCIEGVTLKAPTGSGHTGIGLTRNWPGPAYIGDVLIDGFAYGMRLDHYQYGMTFEDVTFRNQRTFGITNTNNMLALRHVDFIGTVPFYEAKGSHSFISILDSTLVNSSGPGTTGGNSTACGNGTAIASGGYVNLRRTSFSGYDLIIDDTSKNNKDLTPEAGKTTVVKSYDLGSTFSLQGEAKPLDLPIEDVPILRPGKNDTWTDAGSTGESLQAAIDGGAEWIFIKGTVKITETVVLRNKVKLIMGLHGNISTPKDSALVAIRVEDGSTPVVAMEHVCIGGVIEQASKRTFVLRHADHDGLHATGPGKTHIVDVIGKGYQIGKEHTFWARQLNAEFGNEPLFINSGTSVIIGFKMESSTRNDSKGEKGTPCMVNQDGGKLELFAGLLYTLGSKQEHRPIIPAFTNKQGSIAISYRHNGIPATWYDKILGIGDGASAEIIGNDRIKGTGQALLSDKR